jgi:hypothetical protein
VAQQLQNSRVGLQNTMHAKPEAQAKESAQISSLARREVAVV